MKPKISNPIRPRFGSLTAQNGKDFYNRFSFFTWPRIASRCGESIFSLLSCRVVHDHNQYPPATLARKVEPIQIGDLVIDPPIFQAPMAGFTNYAFRQIVREFGGPDCKQRKW